MSPETTSAAATTRSARPGARRGFLGVDVGGTKIAVATMQDGALTSAGVWPTERRDARRLIEQLVALIQQAIDAHAGELAAVGLGIPSIVEAQTGRALASVNVPLRDVQVRQLLRERLAVPVYVDNDATCAALAEAHDDSGQLDVRHLVMFTVGTGIGGGIVIDGRIHRGATGAAGEPGHMLIGAALAEGDPEHSPTFPQPGSLEVLASGRALDAIAAATAARRPDSALGQLAGAGAQVAGPDAVRAAKDGDPDAIAAIALLGRRLGVGIANAVNLLDPDVVAIGGGVCAAGELLMAPAREVARAFILPGVGTRTEIRLARSGPEAGVRGAALLAATELEGERRTPEASSSPAEVGS